MIWENTVDIHVTSTYPTKCATCDHSIGYIHYVTSDLIGSSWTMIFSGADSMEPSLSLDDHTVILQLESPNLAWEIPPLVSAWWMETKELS